MRVSMDEIAAKACSVMPFGITEVVITDLRGRTLGEVRRGSRKGRVNAFHGYGASIPGPEDVCWTRAVRWVTA